MKQFQNNFYFIHIEERTSFVPSHIWAITIFFSLVFKYNETSSKYALLVAQTVMNLPVSAGDLGLIPGREDSLEKEMATHSIILA